ncbi:MAG TPA: BON domain-containing protein [Candidatus Dormibacteraeota bacterium]|nr:BON domain-containing protein [Candidatus Dormibacteraeota bacterium]
MFNSIRIQLCGGLIVAGFLAGCGQSDNTTSSNNPPGGRGSRDEASPSQTSRDTGSNRIYAATNDSGSFKDADNSGRNVRDRSDATLTSGDQGNSEPDREITRQIRRALNSNDQFSTVAKNIKIITTNGKVTLRGPVKSAEEKQAVVSAAQSAAGQAPIDDQLEVEAKQ